jgi:heptosyltransferase-2
MRTKPDATGASALEAGRILVLAPNWLGDIVMALPALADVRRRWPAARLTVAARGSFAPLFRAVPGVDGVLPLGGGGMAALSTLNADAENLRAGAYDMALLMPNSFRSAWLARRARIPERWGYGTDFRGPLLTRAVRRSKDRRLHQAEYYQHLTRELGIPPGPLRPAIQPPDAASAAAAGLLQRHGWAGERLIGLAPGAAYGWAKRWPPVYVGTLASYLIRDLEARPVLVGAAADRGTARDVAREVRRRIGPAEADRLIDLVGQTDLMMLTGVLSRCSAFVANDSGAMHLAAALGVPVTAVFGPTREWATAPLAAEGGPAATVLKTDVWCRPCMLRNCPIDHRCMTRVTPEEVLSSVAAQLDAAPPGPA